MTTPRRRIVRPESNHEPPNQAKQAQITKQRHRLESERAALARWMTRLRRAFNAVAKFQRRIIRFERNLTRLETDHVHRP